VLEIRTRVAPVKLETDDGPTVLSRLAKDGWEPAILQSEKFFMQLAGVEDKLDMSTLRRRVDRYAGPYSAAVVGDIFFKGSDVYYFVSNPGEYLADEFGSRVLVRESREPRIEIGVVSLNTEGLDKRLGLFASALETATKSALDGRKTRYMKFDWHDEKPDTPRLDRLTDVSEEESQTTFARANLDHENVAAAEALRPTLIREILIELSEARFAREGDILNRRSKLSDKVRDAITSLKDYGLVTTEYLLECRNTGTSLTRLRTREQLEDGAASAMRCPNCGRNFDEEVSPLKNARGAVWISDDGFPGGVGRSPKRSVPEAAGPRRAPIFSVPCPRT
jgi:hypothetical protein